MILSHELEFDSHSSYVQRPRYEISPMPLMLPSWYIYTVDATYQNTQRVNAPRFVNGKETRFRKRDFGFGRFVGRMLPPSKYAVRPSHWTSLYLQPQCMNVSYYILHGMLIVISSIVQIHEQLVLIVTHRSIRLWIIFL